MPSAAASAWGVGPIGCGWAGGASGVAGSPALAIGRASSVTMVRAAAFDAGSVKLMVSVPTAATASFVVRANRRIENVPVTSGVEAACAGTVGVAGGSVGVVGGSVGGVWLSQFLPCR